MEPRIQYAKTADGVSIALWTLGEGMPYVSLPVFPTHIQLEWHWPEMRRIYERLAERRMLVRYDGRGSGLSDRDVTDLSLDALLLDLEAVVDGLALERFGLGGILHAGPVAIAYAARHPERVSHLALWCTCARYAEQLASSPQLQAIRPLMDRDWETYTETLAHVAFGWSEGEEARGYAAFMRECATQEAARAFFSEMDQYDVTALLPELRVPTLVVHRRQVPSPDVALARDLASRIPNARLLLVEGTSPNPASGDTEGWLAALEEFLDEGEEVRARAPAVEDIHTVLFTDMEGSTALTQRLGDAEAQEVVRSHNTIVRDALKAHAGFEIKHTGDGIMASFTSASRALGCAIAIQRAMAARTAEQPGMPLRVRIGLNAGEPVAEDQDLFGTSVQLAARVCARAEPGEILIPEGVRHLVAGKGFLFSDRGDLVLRGFEDPVRLYEVRWREEA